MEGDEDKAVEVEPSARRSVPDRFGKYRNLRRIGQGGMADVFLAGWRGPGGFDKLVVVKRLRDEVASDSAFREMFLDEARVAARLNHPNVVQTYEVFEDEGTHFITMEYLEGQPLSRLLRECSKKGIKLDAPVCARIVSDMLCGLHYAHEARDFNGVPLQIVHRDVSPQNIFVTYDGQVKVVDFGIAKAELSSTKTQVGFFKGKAAYMAPEQLEGSITIDRRVDVFTTGIILWELLTGKKLMAAESTAKTLVRLLKDQIPRVSEIVPDIDPKLDTIVARSLERDRAARYQTAAEMRNALEEYLAGGHFSVRSEDVGKLVSDLFGEVRAELRREISTQMTRVSEFPRSSSSLAAAPKTGSFTLQQQGLTQPASMSGISLSSPSQPVYSPSPTTGLIPADRPTGLRMQSVVVGAIVAVSVAAVFAMVERTRSAAPVATPPPAAAAPGPPAAVARPSATPTASAEPTVPEPPHSEPVASTVPAAAAAPRVSSVPAWRPARDQRPVPAAQRPAPPQMGIATPAPQTNSPPAAPEPASPRPLAPAASGAPASPAPPATQEGRIFRKSL